jgi:hypothetical protein
MTAMAKGAEGKVTAPPSATANIPKPETSAAEKEKAAAADKAKADKARADAAATDPRRTDRAPAPAEVKKEEPAKPPAQAQGEVKKEEGSAGTLQSLMRDGIVPTTLAFQDLVSKGIKPFQGMLSGVQAKTPLKSEVPVKESLSPGEQVVPNKEPVKPVEVKPVEVKTAEAKPVEAQAKLKTGDLPEVAKTMADAQAKIAQSAQESNKTRGMYDKDAASAYVGASDQAKAVQASMTEGAKFMFSGFDIFATDLSTGMFKTFDFIGTDLSSNFSDKLRGTMDDGLGLFTTDLADNFSAFESLDLPSMVSGLDDYTKQIFAASEEIAKGEAAISEQEANIASAAASLEDPSVDNKDEIAAAVQAMQDNINLQKATIAFNKDSIDKNIMARAETPLTELVAQANKDAQEKIRLAEEAAAEKERQAQAGTMLAGNGQEGALSGSSDLNTALAELIAIGRRTADLNEKQLSVQSSLSGDLFA